MIKIIDLFFKKNDFKWFLLKRKTKFQILNFETFKKEHEFFTKEYTFNDEYIYLRHYTSLDAAKSIIKNKSIFGSNYSEHEMQFNPHNLRSEVHFMLSNNGDINKPKLGNKALLLFKWTGKQYDSRVDKIFVNTLHHDYFAMHPDIDKKYWGKYWESRLYPNINEGLELLGVVDSNNNTLILFNSPININVINHPML